MRYFSHSIQETIKLGWVIAANLQPGDIVCLIGELGSGKTVLVKGIAKGLGIRRNRIISPSFVLLREYKRGRGPLYHFDLYRLKGVPEIAALGYEEYLYGRGISVIEWADRLKYLLPPEYLRIELSVLPDTKRRLKLTAIGKHYQELLRSIIEDLRH